MRISDPQCPTGLQVQHADPLKNLFWGLAPVLVRVVVDDVAVILLLLLATLILVVINLTAQDT